MARVSTRTRAALVAASVLMFPPGAARADGDAGRGAAVAEQWCSACHVTETADAATDGAPAWRSIAMDTAIDFDALRSFLAAPHGQMQHIELTEQQITDVLAYIQSLGFE